MTVNEMIEKLQARVKEEPLVGDAIVTDVTAVSLDLVQACTPIEERLLKCTAWWTTKDGNMSGNIILVDQPYLYIRRKEQ